MRFLLILTTGLFLTSCNTLIGLGRDTKVGYHWTKEKIQGQSEPEYDYGAPVY